MQFIAKTRRIRFSPYKLRQFVDVVRGKNVVYALQWLTTCSVGRVEPIKKCLNLQ